MPLSPELLAVYNEAHYVVLYPEITIRIGEPSHPLYDLMGEMHSAAFVTAANPGSVPRADEENEFLTSALREYVEAAGYVFLEGEGRDPGGRWAPEPSVLILGIERAEAEKLGRAFQQNAIVFCEKGGPPELVVLV